MPVSEDLFGDVRSHLAAIVESSNDAILSKDLSGIVRSCNAAAERVFGYAASELLGQPITILVPPELLAEEADILARLRRGERVEHFETVRLTKDGRRVDISLTVSPVRDKTGVIVGASKTARDITERKRAAEALAAQHEWFRVTLSSVGDAVIATDGNGRVTFLNGVAETLTGWNAAEATGQPLAEVFQIVNEETRRRMLNPVDKVMRIGHVVGLANHTVLIRRDGVEYPIADSAAPIRDQERRIIGVVLVFHDVTEARRAEEAMAKQREWLETTLESIGDAVISTDARGDVVFINPVAERLTKRKAGDVVGRPCAAALQIIDEGTRQPIESPVDRVLREKSGVEMANHALLVDAEGGEIPIDDSAAPIHNRRGEVDGVVMVFRDVTVRRQAVRDREHLLESERAARAEAERASRLKDDFVATVSHELRTPLNAIVGWAHMLSVGRLDQDTARRAVATIKRNAEMQATLISDLLDISRILSGKLSLEKRHVDLNAIVEGAGHAMEPTSAEKGVKLRASVDAAPVDVIGDPARLEQIVLNLLTNAVGFTPAGGRVEVGLRRQEGEAVLTVRDTGKGIVPEFLPYVFERFRQADASTTRRHGGLGLGLAIVRHLVELHGGNVEAQSTGADRGATFTIRLPLADASTASASREPAQDSHGRPDLLAGYRVLVVDDEPDTLELMSFVLGKCGAHVVKVRSVDEALRAFGRTRPHIVVTDIGMPDRDGYELIRTIRSLPTEKGGTVPAIALTAFAATEDRRLALAAGFQDHLAKPVTPAALVALVADVLQRRGSER
jgi:PAS domain S-box-containing protein